MAGPVSQQVGVPYYAVEADLPTEGQEIGNVVMCLEPLGVRMWDGAAWQAVGGGGAGGGGGGEFEMAKLLGVYTSQPGDYAVMYPTSSLTSSPIVNYNQIRVSPTYLARPIDNIQTDCVTAQAGSAIRFVIYADDNGYPGALRWVSADISTATNGVKSVPIIPTYSTLGRCWIGVHNPAASGTAPNLRQSVAANPWFNIRDVQPSQTFVPNSLAMSGSLVVPNVTPGVTPDPFPPRGVGISDTPGPFFYLRTA